MGEIKRWDCIGDVVVLSDPGGAFVSYSDHAARVAELEAELNGERFNLEKARKALADATETWSDGHECWRPATAWAYAQACRALAKQRDRADRAEAEAAGLREWLEVEMIKRNHAIAVKDRIFSVLMGIHQLLDPPIIESNGKSYKFVNPIAAEVLHELSNRIRAIPQAIDAALKDTP